MNPLLTGIVGSTAYGLAREGSDEDRLTVFAWPTPKFFELAPPAESIVEHEPDHTRHEAAKFARLALKCNPTIMELLWLEKYEVLQPLGHHLITLRCDFLSEAGVRNAYGGYARGQIDRLSRRHAEGKEGFASDLKRRTAKHARHCFRLLEQGSALLSTGQLTVRIPDTSMYWDFDDMGVEEIVARFEKRIEEFNQTPSVLQPAPRPDTVEYWLRQVRWTFL